MFNRSKITIRNKTEIPPDDDPVQVPDDLWSESDPDASDEDDGLQANDDLKKENEELKQENEILKKQNEELKKELAALKMNLLNSANQRQDRKRKPKITKFPEEIFECKQDESFEILLEVIFLNFFKFSVTKKL